MAFQCTSSWLIQLYRLYFSFSLPMHEFACPNPCVCSHLFFLSTFSCPFRQRPESATFFARHNGDNESVPVNLYSLPPKSSFGEYSIWAKNHWKVGRKSGFHLLFLHPKSSFGSMNWVPKRRLGKSEQTVRNIFSTHFSTVLSPRLSTHALEKCVETTLRTVCSTFPNLRLGVIKLGIAWRCLFQTHCSDGGSYGGSVCCVGRTQLYDPNEDFGRSDKHFRVRFRSTFQGCA